MNTIRPITDEELVAALRPEGSPRLPADVLEAVHAAALAGSQVRPGWRFGRRSGSAPRGRSPAGLVATLAVFALGGAVILSGLLRAPASAPVGGAASWEPSTSTSGPGQLEETGPLVHARASHTATRLLDGRVLLAGGVDSVGDSLGSAELYDPATGSFAPTGSLVDPRKGQAATLLPDGRVLVVGGEPGHLVRSASGEVFDPATGLFMPAGTLGVARTLPTATLLEDGRVVVIGGDSIGGSDASVDIWDPRTGTFGTAEPLPEARFGHTATRLEDGRVLVVGGTAGTDLAITTSLLWDPATATFSDAGSTPDAFEFHTATLLPNGKVLIIGGVHDRSAEQVDSSAPLEARASAFLWDPVTAIFAPAGSLAEGRWHHTATLLPDGRVLVVGGNGQTADGLASAELWDPDTMSFSPSASLIHARAEHTATLLGEGGVLITGGFPGVSEQEKASAEVWKP